MEARRGAGKESMVATAGDGLQRGDGGAHGRKICRGRLRRLLSLCGVDSLCGDVNGLVGWYVELLVEMLGTGELNYLVSYKSVVARLGKDRPSH